MGMLGQAAAKFSLTSTATSRGVTVVILGAWTADQFDRLNWGDVRWIKKRWGGKLILKDIALDAKDAHSRRQQCRCTHREQPWWS